MAIDNKFRDKLIIRLKERDGDFCFYCETPHTSYTLDHFTPLALDGPSVIENYRLACGACNSFKNSYTPEEWAKRIAVIVKRKKEELKKLQKLLKRVESL